MINFYPTKLKTTYVETIGTPYKWIRRAALLAMAIAGVLFSQVSESVGFFTFIIAAFVHQALVGREYYIDSIFKIRTATDLRLRLLQLQDSEYALESLNKDAAWRGEAPDPEVTERLDEIKRNKAEFKNRIEQFLDQMTKGLAMPEVPKDEEKKPN